MHLALQTANTFTRDIMGDVAGSDGIYYFDALQSNNSTFSNAVDFVSADMSMQALGEAGGVALGFAARFASDVLPSVGRNWASMFGDTQVNALSPMRLRVMRNVVDSNLASETTGFPVLSAKENQILSGYHADTWRMTTLNEGDVVYGGLPGQSDYYTNFETALRSIGNKEIYSENLQIQPHPIKGYRTNIASYEVLKDSRVPSGMAQANPQFGSGGGQQYFINNYSNLLRLKNEYNLEKFYDENKLPENRFCPPSVSGAVRQNSGKLREVFRGLIMQGKLVLCQLITYRKLQMNHSVC